LAWFLAIVWFLSHYRPGCAAVAEKLARRCR
jgi:hypothetical protein